MSMQLLFPNRVSIRPPSFGHYYMAAPDWWVLERAELMGGLRRSVEPWEPVGSARPRWVPPRPPLHPGGCLLP